MAQQAIQRHELDAEYGSSLVSGTERHWLDTRRDIFEGTEQIQQLVISRAVSGVRIQ